MRRVLFFAYGLVAYVLFLGTFLYAVGFVGGAAVPKSINSGVEGPVGQAVIINILLLSLFVIQHTIMARPAFKNWWTGIVPKPIERSTFVLLTCCVLILMFWQWRPITGSVWNVQQTWARVLLLAVFCFGWLLVLYSSFLIDHFELFGLRQVYLPLVGREYTPPVFVERSVYKLVRHPLMAGFLIAFWATPDMTGGHLLFAVMTTAYIFFGTYVEERDLLRAHGEEYRAYRERTPMLVPWARGSKRRTSTQAVPPTSRPSFSGTSRE